jgi:serine/threonine protein kinase
MCCAIVGHGVRWSAVVFTPPNFLLIGVLLCVMFLCAITCYLVSRAVWGAVSKLDRREVAIKVIPLAGLKPSTEAGIRREADILRHLHHKNIVKSYDFIDTTTHLNVVLERVDGGELFDRIIKKVMCCVCSNSVVLYLWAVIAATSLVSISNLRLCINPSRCVYLLTMLLYPTPTEILQ